MILSSDLRLARILRLMVVLWLLLAAPVGSAMAQTVLPDLPERISPDTRYIIYVHGRIIETQGPEAVSDRFGPYDFKGITQALSARGHIVIAQLRAPGSLEHVDTIVQQLRALRRAGVPAKHITVVGFSKGGYMALRAAWALRDPGISYAILAGCVAEAMAGEDLSADGLDGRMLSMAEAMAGEDLSADGLDGRMLSMADSADDLGFPCTPLFERNAQLDSPVSIVFHEGSGHGIFYAADPLWLTPLMDWIDAG